MPDAAQVGPAGRGVPQGGGLPAPAAESAGLLPAPAAPPACAKCGGEARRPRDCEHTGWAAYCTECYVELHYYLTETGADGS